MGYDLEKLYVGPRSERRSKRRKVNRILNVLIVLVIVLIIFFGGKLIFGDKKGSEKANSNDGNHQTEQPVPNDDDTQKDSEGDSDTESNKNADTESDETEDDPEADKESDDKTDEVKKPESNEDATVTEGDPNSNIVNTIINPAWTPIGTVQSEPHTIVYDKGSNDRIEMEKAASYATGLGSENMIVWWLGRNGDNSVEVTMSSKDNQQIYRVYIDWVANEGWKPVKVEELKENDKKKQTSKETNKDEDEEETDE
ncbi:YrrS family protein [Fredinandcohnia quinoae]|uniref:DUF1510 family protein n=1 Tax=Fredinandcohnia quinoae TaxID=2918902 RepID=A0AAW5E8V4_9BACI|nr:YrrS family protein [Fredinandcohnia sp. SECRCQ15]MCH1627394.1 DUF1510 family protein [Fredinandcohnia sp. SECRCQ15]